MNVHDGASAAASVRNDRFPASSNSYAVRVFVRDSVALQIERPSQRNAMKSLVHTSRTARRQKPAETRSLWASISRSLARLNGTRRTNCWIGWISTSACAKRASGEPTFVALARKYRRDSVLSHLANNPRGCADRLSGRPSHSSDVACQVPGIAKCCGAMRQIGFARGEKQLLKPPDGWEVPRGSID
jgi:hypothetical protein